MGCPLAVSGRGCSGKRKGAVPGCRRPRLIGRDQRLLIDPSSPVREEREDRFVKDYELAFFVFCLEANIALCGSPRRDLTSADHVIAAHERDVRDRAARRLKLPIHCVEIDGLVRTVLHTNGGTQRRTQGGISLVQCGRGNGDVSQFVSRTAIANNIGVLGTRERGSLLLRLLCWSRIPRLLYDDSC